MNSRATARTSGCCRKTADARQSLDILLCSAGLPCFGYRFERQALAQRDNTLYLITQPGHVAHPSMLRRALAARNGIRSVEVSGFTAAPQETMTLWMAQFREQDTRTGRSMSG